MQRKRIVITGMGIVSPLGNSVNENWDALVAGRSGIGPIERFDVSAYATRIGGGIKGLRIEDYLNPKEVRKVDPFIQYGLVAGIQAVQDAGLMDGERLDTRLDKTRVGAAIGSGIGGLETIETNHGLVLNSGPRRVSPFFVPGAVINMIAGNLAIRYGFQGPNIAIATACTTGAHNIGYAARTIVYGDADVMLAGGAEMATTPVGVAAFSAARALSTRNEEPAAASRPWDRERDGFVLGDGAGILVLEELEHARARNARIYAELVGFGMSDDAFHITAPPADGGGAQLAMRRALADAALGPDSVGYINAHGTSTQAGDVAEARAIRTVFGTHADQLMVSSTKSMTGHLLGAAGAVEAIYTVLALVKGCIPPTINLEHPDEGCDLDFVPQVARVRQVEVAMSNSFGFGGTNASLVFRRWNGASG